MSEANLEICWSYDDLAICF